MLSLASSNNTTASSVSPMRSIRSFVRRTGRLTKGQARALTEVGSQWVLDDPSTYLDLTTSFGRTAPCVLEIGFGMGEATAAISALQPDVNFLTCEVHTPGVGALLQRIKAQGLTNIRILTQDALEILRQHLEPACLSGIHIFFPDPWHKKRHHKRRLIQPDTAALFAQALKPNGYIHCATDWQPYAEHMLEVLSHTPSLVNTASGFAVKPDYRPLTKFEARGLRLGHSVFDLVFKKC